MDKVAFLKRVLTDAEYRRTLETSPEKILGPNYTQADVESIRKVLAMARQVDSSIEHLGPMLLCSEPPPDPPIGRT